MNEVTLKILPKEDIVELRQAFGKQNVKFSERMFFRDDASNPATLLGELILNKEVVLTAIGALSGWLVAKQGRKVRLKTTEFEVEAASVEELEQVLAVLYKNDTTTNVPPL